jgi:hypothetical protein
MLLGQGDGLAQSMRQVPPHYFTEEFSLSRYASPQLTFPTPVVSILLGRYSIVFVPSLIKHIDCPYVSL